MKPAPPVTRMVDTSTIYRLGVWLWALDGCIGTCEYTTCDTSYIGLDGALTGEFDCLLLAAPGEGAA